MMGWSLQRFLAIRFSATDHNQTVAHVLSLTSRAKPRTGQNILCLHLPLRWTTSFGRPASGPLAEFATSLTLRDGGVSHAGLAHLTLLFTVPDTRVRLSAEVVRILEYGNLSIKFALR